MLEAQNTNGDLYLFAGKHTYKKPIIKSIVNEEVYSELKHKKKIWFNK